MAISVGEATMSRDCLEKTEYSDMRICASDASELFSAKRGAVTFQLSLPYNIRHGVYYLCGRERYFTDYLLFAVNPADKFITPPGIYAALTPDGIQFVFWTLNGQYAIVDQITSVDADTQFTIDFAWDWSGDVFGLGAKMAVFVNGTPTAAGNFPISPDSLQDVEFTALDTAAMDFGTSCLLCDFATFSEVPQKLRHLVTVLTGRYLGRDFVVLCGRDSLCVWNDDLEDDPLIISEIGCLKSSQHSVAVCDTSHDIYVASYNKDGLDSGSVVLFSESQGRVTKRITGLRNPRAVAVTQVDGVGYPGVYTAISRKCPYVWIADEEEVILADHDLNIVATASGFSAPECITPLSDGRAWVCDTGNDRVVLLDEGTASEVVSIGDVFEPALAAVTVRAEFFCYERAADNVLKIVNADTLEASAGVGSGVVSMDINPNSGIVMIAFADGRIRTYNRNLTPIGSFQPVMAIAGAAVKRGYNQSSFFYADVISGVLYRAPLATAVCDEELSLGDLLFSGAISGPAYSGASIAAEVDISGGIGAGFEAIHDIAAPQFKVDTLEGDLTGGRENEAEDRKSGLRRGDKPTDLRPGTLKGERLPE